MEPTGTEGDEESPEDREDRYDEQKRLVREAAVNFIVIVLGGVVVKALPQLF